MCNVYIYDVTIIKKKLFCKLKKITVDRLLGRDNE